MRLLGYYRSIMLHEVPSGKRISTQFHNDLAQYYRTHRDVGFYAEKACLSPKHFSTVVKNETGHSAAWWIHSRIIAESKMLLNMRRFDDQAFFSRFFHREKGLYPSVYREKN